MGTFPCHMSWGMTNAILFAVKHPPKQPPWTPILYIWRVQLKEWAVKTPLWILTACISTSWVLKLRQWKVWNRRVWDWGWRIAMLLAPRHCGLLCRGRSSRLSSGSCLVGRPLPPSLLPSSLAAPIPSGHIQHRMF